MKITADVREYAANLGANERAALGLDATAEAGMKEMSDKFNAMGQQVYVDADKAGVKPPHTTALDTEAAHQAKNAGLVKESNTALQ
jgi:phosphomethylpyrimidine synthase